MYKDTRGEVKWETKGGKISFYPNHKHSWWFKICDSVGGGGW